MMSAGGSEACSTKRLLGDPAVTVGAAEGWRGWNGRGGGRPPPPHPEALWGRWSKCSPTRAVVIPFGRENRKTPPKRPAVGEARGTGREGGRINDPWGQI